MKNRKIKRNFREDKEREDTKEKMREETREKQSTKIQKES